MADTAAPPATPRPPRSAWRRNAARASLPALAAASVGCCAATLALADAHLHHQSGACRYMPVPWTHFAAAYGGLLAAVLAVTGYVLTARERRRREPGPAPARQSWAAAFAVVVAGCMIPVTALVLVLTHTQAAETARKVGTPLCEG